ncbi:LPS translocon maturation chaperone LptM [Geomesophilobacter sediminis]|uniref:Fibronectin type III domain-containing protein n=1 Tax=Geomesophilobacter sediminis TaxID=2798584 RepID=A0A8J7IQ37_9BACT|nr:lipoprotein [Geomesophilobacter sediminis]MBJ6724654.1 fibronectin type III domain-containing protein [Geomesophilobacter sediminis]
MRRLSLLLICLLLAACGKKGPLIPPEGFAPAAVSNLKAEQKGTTFELTWSAPGKVEGGTPLPYRDLAGFVLLRHVVLPPAEECDECRNAYAELKHVDVDFLREVRIVDGLFLTDDPFLKEGETYQYKVIAIKRDGTRSKDSNKPRRKFVTPPPTPTLQVVPSTTAIDLEITAAPPAKGTFLGYNLYRWKKGEPEPIRPLNGAPLKEKAYHDQLLLPEVTYRYKVRTAAVVDGENIESAGSNVVEAALVQPD